MLFKLLVITAYLFGATTSFHDSLRQEFSTFDYRSLKAARRHSNVLKRSDEIVAKTSIELTYVEESNYAGDNIAFASRVHLGGDRPTLLVEDFEHLLDMVECTHSTMILIFRDVTFFEKAKGTCASLNEGLVVSSHSSCSESSAHSVFDISSVEYDEANSRIVLGVQRTTWLKGFQTRKIKFGQTSDPHYLHQHDRLSRRQAETTRTSESTLATGLVASAALTLIPTATPTAESVTFDLSNDQTDTTFTWPGGIEVGPPFPITVGCKKCTTKGQLILTQGEIDLTDYDELTEQFFDPDKDMDFIKTGFFELELSGFESSILLKASPSVSVPFTYDLFTVPVYGFKIPGFGYAGVMFQPQLVFDISISGGVELTWGFKVNVPDKSTIRLDVGTFNNSFVTGFNETAVESLPFNANVSDINLGLRAGLRPFIPIGMSFFSDKLTLLGGPFLDLPYINTTITQLATSNVNANCETGKGQGNAKFQDAFKNLTHIEASLGMSVGFEFEATVDIIGILPARFDYAVWSTEMSLPTACMAWGKETGMSVATVAEKKVNAASSARVGSLQRFAGVGSVFMAIVWLM